MSKDDEEKISALQPLMLNIRQAKISSSVLDAAETSADQGNSLKLRAKKMHCFIFFNVSGCVNLNAVNVPLRDVDLNSETLVARLELRKKYSGDKRKIAVRRVVWCFFSTGWLKQTAHFFQG